MPEEHAAHHAGSGIGHILQKTTAGLPNWAWLLIIAGGIAAAYIVPKLFGTSQTADTSATDGSTTPSDLSSLSPAVPSGGTSYPDTSGSYGAVTPPPSPTTTAASGQQAATDSSSSQLNTQNALNNTGTGQTLNPWVPATTPAPGEPWYVPYQQAGAPFGTQPSPQVSGGKYHTAKYITIGSWPAKQLGWAAIAAKYHITVKRLEQLNPTIPGLSQGGHGSAHPGETIRIA